MFNILIAEDDNDIRSMMSEYLENNGFNIFEAEDGEKAFDIMDSNHIDLMITDIMMPNINGYTLTKDLRGSGFDLPILMITAKETIEDKEQGFLLGTDDYLVKPIILKEMLLRVNALLKRSKADADKKIILKNTELNYENFTALLNGNEVILTKKEFLLLFKLLSNSNRIFSRAKLMDEIWGYDTESDDGTIKVHISKLRDKFKGNGDFEIVTLKGLGYKAVLL